MTEHPDCTSCPLDPDRREFLRTVTTALASLGLLGLLPRDADAASVRAIAALAPAPGDRRDEKRYPMPAADGVSIDKDNSVIVARAAGKVYAFSLACPHQNTALRWDDGDHEFHCPKHKSRYRADGTFIEGRATRDMDRLVVRRDGATLVVDIDSLIQQDEHPAEWAAAFVLL
ncbi:MAG TPA: Rieske (2Fe-2S) protein [Gemmatimonadaceae bacterium]|nr:Rieske (2Fe-2S) protein [Gemmatimonadaceae bacterium]